MIVEKINYIKTGDFSQFSNSEVISELKLRAFYLSKLRLVAPDRLIKALEKEIRLGLVEADYETHLPEDLKALIGEVSYRVLGKVGRGKTSKYQEFNDRELYRLLLSFMSELFLSLITRKFFLIFSHYFFLFFLSFISL